MVLVAAGVFAVRPGHRAHQAFALFFVVRALNMVGATASQLSTGETAAIWSSFTGAAVTALLPALVWFVSAYPERRGPIGTTRWGPWLLLAAGVALELAYLSHHEWFVRDRSTYAGYLATKEPLGDILFVAAYAGIGAAALLFTVDHVRSPAGRRCRSLFFVMLAFTVHAMYDCGSFWLGVNANGANPSTGLTVAYVTESVPLLASIAVFLAGFKRRGEPGRQRDVATYATVLALSLAASILTERLQDPTLALANAGFSRLLTAGLVAYALLSRQLLEVDVVIRWTIKRGTVVGILLATFFVASQLMQSLLPNVLGGPVWGGVAVGLLLFAIAPLQRFAERLSEKAMPHAKKVGEMAHGDREAIYLDLARSAWKDGTIDRSERALLDQLQEKLGLSADAAKRLERQALA
jgi:hypothetical protein